MDLEYRKVHRNHWFFFCTSCTDERYLSQNNKTIEIYFSFWQLIPLQSRFLSRKMIERIVDIRSKTSQLRFMVDPLQRTLLRYTQ